ncbi:A/G-specific adenine glycosylase [Zongyangia hominis]|uniref:Adenine DNA glycosylase n=1 Tax=Zongyangia hominis TaxID=2763677 RepID=A0A926EDP4_9FIRM|nr:A/G-specific adenine glycosylase [Zongyangia hominis]MBC8571163.1 A/G-specific adenine glycosylase [Zongyangia hominis]
MNKNNLASQIPEWQERLTLVPAPLLAWYDKSARVLPWRSNPVPYHVWVSEIMLQQTRVEAVKPYFDRFLSALPTIESLAGASEEQILKLWEGLGYYNRVRNLKKAAIQVVERYSGQLPADFEALCSLPGIGVYTAGAIASIAFGLPVPAVDGNVLRVASRVLCSREDISKEAVKKAMAQALAAILPKDRVGDFNQALMELGAMVCLPGAAPRCESCPLAAICEGHRQSVAEELPVKAAKKPPKAEEKTVVLLLAEGKVALRKRPDTGLLAGLWELPNWEGHLSPEALQECLGDCGINVVRISQMPDARHVFTHRIWEMRGYAVYCESSPLPEGWVWVTLSELREGYALPGAFSAFAKQLPKLTSL